MHNPASDLGPFTGLRVMHRTPTIELLTGIERGRYPVVLVALTAEAAKDANWCAEFADAVARDATTLEPIDVPVHISNLYGRRPWAASRIQPGRRGAERILNALPGAVAEGTDPTSLLNRPPGPGRPPGQAPRQPPRPAPQPAAQPVPQQPAQTGPPTPASSGQPAPPAPLAPLAPSAPPAPPVAHAPTSAVPAAAAAVLSEPPVSPGQRPTVDLTAGPRGPAPAPSTPPGSPVTAMAPSSPATPQDGASRPRSPAGTPAARPSSPPDPRAAPRSNAATPTGPARGTPPRPATGPPPGSPAAPKPPADGSRTTLLLVVCGVVALALVICGIGSVFVLTGGTDNTAGDSGAPAPAATGQPTASGSPTSTPARDQAGPSPVASPLPSTTPEFSNSAPAVPLLGPVFTGAADDQTVLAATPGWPFAFRMPVNWTCNQARYPGVPDSYAMRCGPQEPLSGNAFLVLRRCPWICGPDEQDVMDRVWFDGATRLVRTDPTTVYTESAAGPGGDYELSMSHFFAPRGVEELRWQIGVLIAGPLNQRVPLLKVVNDIHAQAG